MKTIKLQKGEKYLIEWNDTYSFQGWHGEDDVDERIVKTHFQSTVGFYIKKNKDWVIFCAHHNPHEGFSEYGLLSFIPTGCILNIKKLK